MINLEKIKLPAPPLSPLPPFLRKKYLICQVISQVDISKPPPCRFIV